MIKKNEMPSPVVHIITMKARLYGNGYIIQYNTLDGTAVFVYSRYFPDDMQYDLRNAVAVWRVKKTTVPIVLRLLARL